MSKQSFNVNQHQSVFAACLIFLIPTLSVLYLIVYGPAQVIEENG